MLTKKKHFLRYSIALIGISLAMVLSGCANALQDRDIKLTPPYRNYIMLSTYDYQGQKIDQLKLTHADITADKNIDTAIDIKYGQNKIVHANTPLLIYSGLTNFADQYDRDLANKKYVDTYGNPLPKTINKANPVSGTIYGMFRRQFPKTGSVAIVKSKSGAPIGIFTGHKISVHDFDSDSEDSSDALLIIDGHKVFVYSGAYTVYPVSAMRSAHKQEIATNKAQQAGIATKQIMPKTSTSKKGGK